jgi:MFS family permease
MSFTSTSTIPFWRNRDLATVAIGQAISALGTTVAATTLLLYMQAHGRSSWAVAGVLAAEMVPMVAFAPAAGLIVDRFDSRTLIVLSSLWQAAACTALAFCANLALVFPLVFAIGCGSVVGGPTFSALLPRIVGEQHIARASSIVATSNGVATVAGPGLAGLLYAASGLRGPFLIDAASFLAITAAAFLVRTRRRVVRDDATAPPRMRDGITVVLGNPLLRGLILMLVAFVVVGEAVNVVEVYFVRSTLHQSAATYGLLGTTWTVAMLAGAMLAGPATTHAQLVRMTGLSGFALAAALALLAVAPSMSWVFALFALGGLGNGMVNVSSSALVVRNTHEDQRGRVLAAVSGMGRAAGIGALVLGGVLAGALPPRQVIGICGLTAVATLAVTLPPLLRSRAPQSSGRTPAGAEPIPVPDEA